MMRYLRVLCRVTRMGLNQHLNFDKKKNLYKLLSLNRKRITNSIKMDIQATKLELIQLMLSTKKEQVLARIKNIFEQEGDIDFWDSLNLEDQAAIDEGLDQLEKGQYISHESVRDEIKDRFNFK